MIITEAELRDQLRVPQVGAQVNVPSGVRLSPSAADFVKQWQLVVVETGLPEPRTELPVPNNTTGRDWDKESSFPIAEVHDAYCTQCGTAITDKPSWLTQLNAHHFVRKNHPRIRLRGRFDSLHSLVLLTASQARSLGVGWLADDLDSVAAYVRELLSGEYNERPVAEFSLADWDAEAIHDATHDPASVLGIDHLTISSVDPMLLHWLNLCRSTTRELEIAALDVFESPHHPYGASIAHGLNRLSSVFYFLQLRLAKES
jgi:ethanolamine utilization cobalamin adenosyltransferase